MTETATILADMPTNVAEVFEAAPEPVRKTLLELRNLIANAAAQAEVGPLTETLKWGEPAYIPPAKAGTAVRLGWKPATPNTIRLLVNCRTSLVEQWREHYGDTLDFEGRRALVLPAAGPLPTDAVRHCIALALTYRRR